jgi:hypothetical protein
MGFYPSQAMGAYLSGDTGTPGSITFYFGLLPICYQSVFSTKVGNFLAVNLVI